MHSYTTKLQTWLLVYSECNHIIIMLWCNHLILCMESVPYYFFLFVHSHTHTLTLKECNSTSPVSTCHHIHTTVLSYYFLICLLHSIYCIYSDMIEFKNISRSLQWRYNRMNPILPVTHKTLMLMLIWIKLRIV